MSKTAPIEEKLKELNEWLATATDLDQRNFMALVDLGLEAVEKLPEGVYRDRAVIMLAVVRSGRATR